MRWRRKPRRDRDVTKEEQMQKEHEKKSQEEAQKLRESLARLDADVRILSRDHK